jgi:uncharacterized protein (DUF2141 family)
MKSLTILCLASINLFHYASAQYKLEIEIVDLISDNGPVMLELFDADHKLLSQKKTSIQNRKSTVTIENLKPGKYAVRYFHDENSNGKLDTKMFGMPTEGYGFSNNAYGTFGPKPFEEWLVDVSKDTRIVLKTKN